MNITLTQSDVRNTVFSKLAQQFWIADVVSFGLIRYWREYSLQQLHIEKGMVVCDAMCGHGFLWPSIQNKLQGEGKIVAVDACPEMILEAENSRTVLVELHHEDFLESSIAPESVDRLVCTFGLKALTADELSRFMLEVNRILKPGGEFSVVELHIPANTFLSFIWRAYLGIVWLLIALMSGELYNVVYYLARYTDHFSNGSWLENSGIHDRFEAEISKKCFGSILSIQGKKRESLSASC
jgi:ubiquinone/menaquinone biosynthesis C-methylase UbiE